MFVSQRASLRNKQIALWTRAVSEINCLRKQGSRVEVFDNTSESGTLWRRVHQHDLAIVLLIRGN